MNQMIIFRVRGVFQESDSDLIAATESLNPREKGMAEREVGPSVPQQNAL
jgi:hypothetical protein